MKSFKYLFIVLAVITIAAVAYKDSKKEMLERQREQAILDYYQDVETLLDSLYIDCGDTILETDAGAKYLESKYTFDSLFIDNNYDRRN